MVKQKFNWLSQQRVDIPHIRSIEDGALFDFATLWKIFQADTPYILNQFNVANPPSTINSPAGSIQINVAGGIVTLPDDPNGSFIRVPSGTPPEQLSTANTKVTGSFTANSTNYVSVIFTRQTDNTTADLVSFWDVDSKTEFTRTVPTGLVLNYQFVINTVGFGTNAPLCIVTTNASNQVQTITNAKQSLFRLGTGGASPNPNYNYVYPITPENSITISSAGGADPFRGGDWELGNLKAWMDAVMTSFKQLKGGAFWYANGSTLVPGISVFSVFQDANDSLITGAGRFIHSKVTPGLLTWTSDMFIKSITGDLIFRIPAGNITLANEQVGYILLQRDVDFQPANMFTFTNASATVSAIGTVTGINPGDWIKPKAADISTWRKILTIVGVTITLDKPYTGVTTFDQAVKTIQDYTITVADPVDVPASGSMYWIAKRDDFSFSTETIAASPTGAVRVSGVVTITTTSPTQVAAGQVVEISGVTDATFNGLWEVQTVSGSTFTYAQPGQPDATSGSGSVISIAKIYLRQMGELNQGESINIDDTVSNETLQFIGATSSSDNFPGYAKFLPGPLSYIADGQSLTNAIALLDQQAGASTLFSKQDRNLKFVRGGVFNFTNPVLSWSQDAFIQVPGLPEARNTIPAGNVTLTNDGDVAYVEINRLVGATANLTVSVAQISALVPTNNTVIIARKFGAGGVALGTLDGTLAQSNPSLGMFVLSNKLYVSDAGFLKIYDISGANATAPLLLGSLAISNANRIIVSGTIAYVAGGSGGFGTLTLVDVSVPASPAVLGTLTLASTENIFKMGLSGTHMFITTTTGIPAPTSTGTLKIVDVSVPATPALVGTPIASGRVLDGITLQVFGTHLYETNGTLGGLIYDISTPTTPSLSATFAPGGVEFDWHQLVGSTWFVLDSTANLLKLYDLTVPTAPTLISSTASGANSSTFCVLGTHVYVSHVAPAILTIIDITVPGSPVTVYSGGTFTGFNIVANGNYVYSDVVLTGPTNLNILQGVAVAGSQSVIVGSHSFLLQTGESKENDAGLSIQNRTYLGITDETTSSPAWNSSHSVPLRFIPADSTDVTSALSSTNIELDKLFGQFRIRSSVVPDVNVSITGSDVTMLTGETLSQVLSNLLTSFPGASINFQTGVVTGVPGNFTPVIPAAGMYRWFSIGMLPSSTTSDQRLSLQVLVIPASGDGSSPALAPKAPFSSDAFNLGQVVIFSTDGSTVSAIPMSSIVQLGIGSGSGSGSSGSGVGDDLDSLTYRASFRDQLKDLPSSASNVIDYSSGHTDPNTFSLVNHYFRLAYDASKTIAAGTTATSIILSSAASYTVKNGDIVRIGTEARRIITTVNQFTFTVEGTGFSATPTLGQQVTVSQAVYTQDINNFSGTGQPISASLTDNINDLLMQYGDSITINDIIPDWNFVPRIAFDASSNGAGNPTPVGVRLQGFVTTEQITIIPSPGTNLFLRFFSNFTSGSGFVNLLNYRCFFHREPVADFLPALDQSSGRTDGLGAIVNCTVDNSGSFTIIGNLPTYSVGVNPGTIGGQLEVYINGQKLPRFLDATSTPAGWYQELDGNSIRLDTNYGSLSLEFEVLKRVGTVDVTDDNVTNISSLDEIFNDKFQTALDQDFLLLPVNGSPGPGQFRSEITNRAPILDLTQDLLPRMGIDRHCIQQLIPLMNESGPNGEAVYGALNDRIHQFRFVGYWTSTLDNLGQTVGAHNTNDYIEVVFYGTGLNMLTDLDNSARDYRVSIDGGSEGANIYPTGASPVLEGQNFSANQILPIASGLPLAVHTAKIRSNSNVTLTLRCHGFDILNIASTITVPPGKIFTQGKALMHPTLETLAYNSGFESGVLGTKGGRVLMYLKPDGTVGKALTPTNSSLLTMASTNHTGEEIIRKHHWREFGAGKSDDFSTLTVAGGAAHALTLDDDTTTLVGSFAVQNTPPSQIDTFINTVANSFMILTFVGTGLDILATSHNGIAGSSPDMQVTIDGNIVSSTGFALTQNVKTFKIASGLSYGTHVVQITNLGTGAAVADVAYVAYNIYGPKKPSLPNGAAEIAEYNILGNYVANTTAGLVTIAQGTLRKGVNREHYFNGATVGYGGVNATAYIGAQNVFTQANGEFHEFVFFGTGFELRSYNTNSSTATITVSLNGLTLNSTNYPGLTTSSYGTSVFTYASGNLSENGVGIGSGMTVSGLPLAQYTIRFTNGGGGFSEHNAIDVITPIHAQKFNERGQLQNTLTIGSQGISDSRQFSIHKDLPENKNWSQANGVTANFTQGGGPIPVPDLSTTLRSKGSLVEIEANATFFTNAGGGTVALSIYVDGAQVGLFNEGQSYTTSGQFVVANKSLVYLPKGEYKIDAYWNIGGGASTMTTRSTHRVLTARET